MSVLFTGNQQILLYQEMQIYKYRFYLDTKFLIPLTFLESLRIVLINIVTILMMAAKKATPGLLKTKLF